MGLYQCFPIFFNTVSRSFNTWNDDYIPTACWRNDDCSLLQATGLGLQLSPTPTSAEGSATGSHVSHICNTQGALTGEWRSSGLEGGGRTSTL